MCLFELTKAHRQPRLIKDNACDCMKNSIFVLLVKLSRISNKFQKENYMIVILHNISVVLITGLQLCLNPVTSLCLNMFPFICKTVGAILSLTNTNIF